MTKKQTFFPQVSKKRVGTLIIIGGREDKEGKKLILQEVAKRTGAGKMIIATLASQHGEEQFSDYRKIFHGFGVKHIHHFYIEQTGDAHNDKFISMFENAKTIFFTGGDQLKITTRLGGTPILDKIFQHYQSGGIIAGTSAGAAAMGASMLVGSDETESHKVGYWKMAPGLGLLEDMIIDQHFAQRARIGRLLGAIAMSPGLLGIGIDEDTSIILEKGKFKVLGQNAVYVIDGHNVTYTNVSESNPDLTMSLHNVNLHVLCSGEEFDLDSRKALTPEIGDKE